MNSLTKKEEVIMNLLFERDEMYGLDMVKNSRELKRGTVYVTLDRMEDKGLISSRLVDPEKGSRGPARRMYKLTGAGKRVLQAWMEFKSAAWGSMGWL